MINRHGFSFVLVLSACAVSPPPEASQPIPIDGTARVLDGERYIEYRVGVHVDAPPEKIWALLVDATNYPTWNTTVIRIDGTIAQGEEIALTSAVDPDRTFDLTVSQFVPNTKLVWEDGGNAFHGVRTFVLTDMGNGTTDVTMAEALSGTMMGMIESKLPDFRPSFNEFAADLKTAAEAG